MKDTRVIPGKKIGAPPKRDPRPGERFTIATRVRPELKRRLDAAAAESGRSQAQETELRLERSFDRTDLLGEVLNLAYGEEIAAELRRLGEELKAIEAQREKVKARREKMEALASFGALPLSRLVVRGIKKARSRRGRKS